MDYTYISTRSGITLQGELEKWHNMGYVYQSVKQLRKEIEKEKDQSKMKSIKDIIEMYEQRHKELLNQIHHDDESIHENTITSEKEGEKKAQIKEQLKLLLN